MGRKKTPTAVLKIRGSWRAKIRTNEPRVESATGDPPQRLTGKALDKWRELVPVLQSCGIFTKADADAFANYCELWAEWCDARDDINKNGSVNEDGDRLRPIAKRESDLSQRLIRIASEFGMTPSSRSSVKVGETTEKKASRFFKQA